MDDEIHPANVPQTNKRKLKKLYSRIRKQMEFYFSDSNMMKDKFLQDLIGNDGEGYVDLEVFMTFNKIKALTDDVKIIATALLRSNLLKLSSDEKRVKRITPVECTKDFDACTIYVEKLPSYADRKWVQDVFGHFGVVDHVNVPRFKVSNKIKGFAFVEFRNPESVQSSCEFYKSTNGKDCSTSEDESKISKTGKKRKNEDKTDKKTLKAKSRHNSESAAEKQSKSEVGDKNATEVLGHDKEMQLSHTTDKKRKREISEDDEPLKRLKENENNTSAKNSKDHKGESTTCEKVTVMESEQSEAISDKDKTCTGSENIVGTGETPHKTKRKRRNTKKIRNSTDRPILRVMSKAAWKSYRNKYLELQKATMCVLKKQLMLETQELKEQEINIKTADTVPESTKKTLLFQPGVIIKVKLSEPIKKTSDIKDQVKANAIVAYVDAVCDKSEIYVRCHTSEEAQAILNEEKLHHLGPAELLKDAEEADYWKKIEMDRNNKFNSHARHKKRGRDKVISKAAKLEEQKNRHIYFDE